MKRLIGMLVLLSVSACGGSNNTTAPSPVIVQAAGVWIGVARLATVTGGDCLGPLLQGSVGGSISETAAITQAGSSLTATVTSQGAGTSCAFTGTAGSSTISLNATSCQVGALLGAHCTNGAVRDIRLFAAALTANIAGNSGSGNYAETWNVYVGGSSTPFTTLILSSTFTMSK